MSHFVTRLRALTNLECNHSVSALSGMGTSMVYVTASVYIMETEYYYILLVTSQT